MLNQFKKLWILLKCSLGKLWRSWRGWWLFWDI